MKWSFRKTAVIVISVIVMSVIVLAVGAVLLVPSIEKTLARIHQEGITKELSDWSLEFGTVGNLTEAAKAIDMLRYIEAYYVAGPGYRSDYETERRLEEQRKKTIEAIVSALQVYSGKSIGDDPNAWETWMKSLGARQRGASTDLSQDK